MKKGFWIGLIIVAAIFLLAGGYIFVTVRNYLDSEKWEVHDPIPDDRRKFYANTALMPELSDDFERFAIRGIRDFDYMVETYSFSGTDEMYGKLPEGCENGIAQALSDGAYETAKDLKGKDVSRYEITTGLPLLDKDEINKDDGGMLTNAFVYYYVLEYPDGTYRFAVLIRDT
ncbi:MAG: hypothetical protein K6F03_06095 [Saccharofermentans sp.]|nr:hypothetical protein [Saccharofermentans sp.]